MMLHVDTHTDYYASRVRIAHTETATKEEIIARAYLDSGIAYHFGADIKRADDMSGPEVFEVTTVTFWRD